MLNSQCFPNTSGMGVKSLYSDRKAISESQPNSKERKFQNIYHNEKRVHLWFGYLTFINSSYVYTCTKKCI